jgi:hypothetical protein
MTKDPYVAVEDREQAIWIRLAGNGSTVVWFFSTFEERRAFMRSVAAVFTARIDNEVEKEFRPVGWATTE